MLVVESAKFFQSPNQFRYRLEVTDPQQLLLERPEEAFNTAVAFRFANKRRRRLNPQEGEFVLEVIAHELRTVIVPESESFGGAAPEAAEVLRRKDGQIGRRSYEILVVCIVVLNSPFSTLCSMSPTLLRKFSRSGESTNDSVRYLRFSVHIASGWRLLTLTLWSDVMTIYVSLRAIEDLSIGPTSHLQVIQKLGRRGDSRYHQVIPGTGAGDIKQMSLRVVDLFEIRIIRDSFDALL